MRSALFALLCAAIVAALAACQPDQVPAAPATALPPASASGGRLGSATPSPSTTPTPSPTPTPTEVAVSAPARRAGSVGLVVPIDQEGALRGAREAFRAVAREAGVEALEVATQPGDVARNAVRLAESGFEAVFVATHNVPLAAWVAQRYPATRVVVFGRLPDPAPPNLVCVDFAADQAGFLAGTLAGWLTQRDMVAFVGARPSVEIVKFRKGYEHGVRYVNSKAVVLGNYLDSYTAPEKGAAEARAQLDEGADILFAVGGATARGALAAAAARGVPVIGAETDIYLSEPAVAPWLTGVAVVRLDKAMADVVRGVKQGTLKGGTLVYDAKNGGVELGPYYDWAARVPEAAQQQISEIFAGLQQGKVKTNVEIPLY